MKQFLFVALSIACLGAAPAQTGFRDTFTRYVSGHDLFRLLRQKFPMAKIPASTGCAGLTDENRGLVGASSPVTGEPTYRTISPAFVRWYAGCVDLYIRGELQAAADRRDWSDLLGKEEAKTLSGTSSWKTLPLAAREAVVRHLLDRTIGPGILADEDARIEKLASIDAANLKDALEKTLFFLTTQEEFLRY